MDLRQKVPFFMNYCSGYLDTVTGNDAITLPKAKANGLKSVKLFGGTEQSSLPSGYTQVEYLKSSGTQLINTGISGDDDLVIDMVCKYSAWVQYAGILGNWIQDGYNATRIITSGTDNDKFVFNCNNLSGGGSTLAVAPKNTRLHIVLEKGSVTVNGVTAIMSSLTGTVNDTAIALFNRNVDNPANRNIELEIESYFVTKNNVVIQNLVPCRRNSDNVLGMYDTVSQTFLTNAGTGTFTAGAEAVPTPSRPIDIVSNNGVVKVRQQSGLPLSYTALEYIQSSGSQYIDTGRVPNNNDIIEQKFQKVGNSTTTCAWYGSMPSSSEVTPRIGIGSFSNQGVVTIFSGINYTGMIGTADTNVHTLRFQATGKKELTYTFDGVIGVIDASTSATPIDMFEPAIELTSYLFARHGTNGVQVYDNEGTKIYYHREYLANGTLVLNMIPVKRNSDNVLGMYDFVSGQFFTNGGTGTFTAGNPVSDPVEIYTDGTTETVEVFGNNLIDLSAVTNGYYYDPQGNYLSSQSSRLTDYIPIEAGKDVRVYFKSLVPETTTLNVRINIFNSNKVWQSQEVLQLAPLAEGTKIITPTANGYIRVSGNYSGLATVDWDTASVTNSLGAATAEMLLKVGDYQDVQEILSGAVTRNIGIKVLDGTEDWQSNQGNNIYTIAINGAIKPSVRIALISSHFVGTDLINANMPDNSIKLSGTTLSETYGTVFIRSTNYETETAFKQFLATQYANGTPVMVIYPLATATTETVTPQTLQVQVGTNVLQITQASIDNLPLEATYKRGK